MNAKEENICRLCLKVAETDFEIIDEIIRKKIEVLLLRVNLDISKDPIICKNCAEVIEKCFNFKSKIIFSSAIDKNRTMFELKVLCRIDLETVGDNSICRFCLNHLSGTSFILFNTLMNDISFVEMLQVLMPEMDFNIIKNSIICSCCRQNLECYFKFVENCLDVEEKITKYLQNDGTLSSAKVKLSDILCFLFKNSSESNYTQICAIKQEEDELKDIGEAYSEVYHSELIKAEALDIKNEVNINETPCESPLDSVYKLNMPCGSNTKIGEPQELTRNSYKGKGNKKNNLKSQTFQCQICTYQTKYKRSLKSHMLIHKDITEVEMYKCSICAYETKHRRNIARHMIIHKDVTEVEMYKCSMCTYQARDKSKLNSHTLIHKDITEVKTYKCSTCTFETKHKRSLHVHMLIHKDITEVEMYNCSVCPYETKRKDMLKSHMLIHKDFTEVTMYKCSMCVFVTKHKRSLQVHMSIHKDGTEVEMYKCSMCTFQAKQKSHLKRHVAIHMSSTNPQINKSTTTTQPFHTLAPDYIKW